LSCSDPDAPGGTFIHWLVHNIPKDTYNIDENSEPEGKKVANDFGNEGYGGPCPPSGTHRYFFTVYALDVESLEISDKNDFIIKVEEHTIDKAEIIGLYQRV